MGYIQESLEKMKKFGRLSDSPAKSAESVKRKRQGWKVRVAMWKGADMGHTERRTNNA